jgi:5-(carboxyamino)imidazole ribonucleotide mutase
VLICGAGGAAHLAGVVAAHTILPVIGVPLGRSLGGLDALYATVQMPPGVPVATVAIDGAVNGALLAAEILALSDDALAARLARRREDQAINVAASDDDVRAKASRTP